MATRKSSTGAPHPSYSHRHTIRDIDDIPPSDPAGTAATLLAALVAGFKYGEMFNFNTATNVVITGSNVWTEVGAGFSAGLLNGVTFQNAKELKIVTPGVYLMWWSLSLNAAGPLDNIEAGILVNGAIDTHTVSHSRLITAADNTTLTSHGAHSLVANDLVSLGVNNNSDGDDIVVEHGNLLIARWPQ